VSHGRKGKDKKRGAYFRQPSTDRWIVYVVSRWDESENEGESVI